MTEIDNYNKQIIILLGLLKAADDSFRVCFDENQIDKVFDNKINFNDLENNLKLLGQADILNYFSGGEDGFVASCEITIHREKYLKTTYGKRFLKSRLKHYLLNRNFTG